MNEILYQVRSVTLLLQISNVKWFSLLFILAFNLIYTCHHSYGYTTNLYSQQFSPQEHMLMHVELWKL
jgi:hypothetical protein